MELMEMILSDENLEEAIRRVKRNRGRCGRHENRRPGRLLCTAQGDNQTANHEHAVQADASPQGLYPQAQWQTKAVGYTGSRGPGGTAGSGAGAE